MLADRPRLEQRVPLDKMELLLHEQMHVFQRAHAEVFDSLYIGQWGFIRAKSIATCPWMVEHQLLNPDAVDCPWVFPILRPDGTKYIWPLCSFGPGPGPKRMEADFSMLAFYVTRAGDGFRVQQSADGRPNYSELMSVRAYREVFPQSTNIYHPHEASADLFAKLVLFDSYSSRGWTTRSGPRRSGVSALCGRGSARTLECGDLSPLWFCRGAGYLHLVPAPTMLAWSVLS